MLVPLLAAVAAETGSLDGVAATHELKAAVVISGPCGDRAPYVNKSCPIEVMYFQSEPEIGPMKLRSFLRCTRSTWNGEVVEDCEYPKRAQ